MDITQFYQAFFEEADELLAQMEKLLLGLDLDAPAALEAVAAIYDLKPAMIGEIDPQTPVDLRRLPTSLDENP